MEKPCPRLTSLTLTVIIVGVAMPPTLYWMTIGRARDISWTDARQMADQKTGILVDVTAEPHIVTGYPADAGHWPLASIMQARTPADIPTAMRGHKLLLICPSGGQSAMAAIHLRKIGVDNAFSVRGGVQEWIAGAGGRSMTALLHGSPQVDAAIPAFRLSPFHEQWAAVLAFFFIKCLYTLINTAIIIALWRTRSPDLVALRRGMIAFFIGEACCAVNVLFFNDDSMICEYIHSAGMCLALGWTVYAIMEGLDIRLIHYSDDGRCAAVGLCRGCIKHQDAACGLRRMFLMLVPTTALLAAMPLLAPLRDTAYNTRIFGILHGYHHPLLEQAYELRYLPVAAIVLLLACLLVLAFREKHPIPVSKVLFSAAVGALGFCFLRLILVAVYVDNQVWFSAWEEITELMYVGVAGGLLLVFARGLGLQDADAQT